MTSPADKTYMSRREMEEALARAATEHQGIILMLIAVITKAGPVDLTTDDLQAAQFAQVKNEPIGEDGFRLTAVTAAEEHSAN